MYTEIIDKTDIYPMGYGKFTLPSRLVRYIDFEKVVAVLLDEDGKKDKIIGVKYSPGRITCQYIAWEFQIVDKYNKAHSIDYFVEEEYETKKVICCHNGFGTMFYIDPDNGTEIYMDKVISERIERTYIEVVSMIEIDVIGNGKLILPSKLVRYIEFENVVAILLDEDEMQDRIIGVKYSKERGPYIAWEFQVVDGQNKTYAILGFVAEEYNSRRVISCYGFGFDVMWYINPDNGAVIDRIVTRI